MACGASWLDFVQQFHAEADDTLVLLTQLVDTIDEASGVMVLSGSLRVMNLTLVLRNPSSNLTSFIFELMPSPRQLRAVRRL